jgi:hypothetical protein
MWAQGVGTRRPRVGRTAALIFMLATCRGWAERPDDAALAAAAQQAIEQTRSALETLALRPPPNEGRVAQNASVERSYEIATRELSKGNYRLALRATRRAQAFLAGASAPARRKESR